MLEGMNGMMLAGFVTPTMIASCVCALLLTSHKLPASTRLSWTRKTLASLRQHPLAKTAAATTNDADYGYDLSLKKVNQFGRGEPDFNVMSWWLVIIPTGFGMLCYIPLSFKWAQEEVLEDPDKNEIKERIKNISDMFGWQSILCLAFYLIPVTRHSVLLAAMGWSPIHALRIHIWTGYISFVFMLLHGILYVFVWVLYEDYPVWQQIVPNRQCWTIDRKDADHIEPRCNRVFDNWTGIVAAVFYIALWGSSLNWVRRRNYRLFYILHMVFGTLTILGIILHMYWVAFYFIPSITYYFASTAPTLIQAVASRFRGGVTIRRVVKVPNAVDASKCTWRRTQRHLARCSGRPIAMSKFASPRSRLYGIPLTCTWLLLKCLRPPSASCFDPLVRSPRSWPSESLLYPTPIVSP